ncbi:MAG: DUF899 family protein [Pseudomonadota bacterium]
METNRQKPFPNEPVAYRTARDRLLAAEANLRSAMETVAEERRALPPGGEVPEDYLFDEWHEGSVVGTHLSDLFEDGHRALILYSYMFGPNDHRPCPSCTSLLDGWNGIAPQVRQRTGLAVVVSSPVARLRDIAIARRWTGFRLLSCADNDYNRDYMGEVADGSQVPMCTVFVKGSGTIRHFWSSELLFVKGPGHPRHMDLTWPLWTMLDLAPEGRGTDWFPTVFSDRPA